MTVCTFSLFGVEYLVYLGGGGAICKPAEPREIQNKGACPRRVLTSSGNKPRPLVDYFGTSINTKTSLSKDIFLTLKWPFSH